METVWQCEKKAFCLDILEKHWPDVPRAEDITEVDVDDIPEAEVWAGGFPCEDVSLARMGSRSGLKGSQSGLFYDFARLIEKRRPELVVLENVAALLSSHDGGISQSSFGRWPTAGMASLGEFLTVDFGVPESRSRVSIVGSLGGADAAGSVLFEPECGDRDSEKGGQDGEAPVSPFATSVGNPEKDS